MLKRISITGPESTGKTWLAKKLAEHYQTVWVHEYAVDYLTKHGPDYKIDDLIKIAIEQLNIENSLANVASDYLFCDTDFLVMKVWSKDVFKQVPSAIEELFASHTYNLYLLSYPDIEWEAAPFRENPDDRLRIFNMYEEELIKNNSTYNVVKGMGEQRFENAVKIIDNLFK